MAEGTCPLVIILSRIASCLVDNTNSASASVTTLWPTTNDQSAQGFSGSTMIVSAAKLQV